ncbi:cupin domain-containing protein [Labrys monachus]|uniref:Cupin superfamily protein n=1 Tax=Labrys monachus TaxID=217067 RepID=A0ABU0FJ36_9HYPH|nr:cupin domain-containing protein [Labrys monachus]MDQ0394629.1 putative cupin superfamily protein [Labrys monachus]
MPLWVCFPAAGLGDPEAGGPAPERLQAGNPAFRTWNSYESADGRTFAGIWEATPGCWRVVYEEWESCTLLAGRSVVTPDGGPPVALGPGDTMILEPGFAGTWEVVETTRKSYVIRL